MFTKNKPKPAKATKPITTITAKVLSLFIDFVNSATGNNPNRTNKFSMYPYLSHN